MHSRTTTPPLKFVYQGGTPPPPHSISPFFSTHGIGSSPNNNTPPQTPRISALPVWARRERLMKRHRTLTQDTPTTPGSSLDDETGGGGSGVFSTTKETTTTTTSPTPAQRIVRPSVGIHAKPLRKISYMAEPQVLRKMTVKDPRFLMAPTPEQLGLTFGETPPQRKVVVERSIQSRVLLSECEHPRIQFNKSKMSIKLSRKMQSRVLLSKIWNPAPELFPK